jgi:hypothetical protein
MGGVPGTQKGPITSMIYGNESLDLDQRNRVLDLTVIIMACLAILAIIGVVIGIALTQENEVEESDPNVPA